MTPEMSVELVSEAVMTVISTVSILVVPSLLVGLVISIFQTATQIQEQTLSFLPRLVVTLLVVIFTGNWLLARIVGIFHQIFTNIPGSLG